MWQAAWPPDRALSQRVCRRKVIVLKNEVVFRSDPRIRLVEGGFADTEFGPVLARVKSVPLPGSIPEGPPPKGRITMRSTPPATIKRRRKKRHLAWEQAELSSGGVYGRNLEAIAREFPQLTPMEARVSALVRAMLPSWKIGELLGITEKSVENYRVKIRRKTGCCDKRLHAHLAGIGPN